jgi:diguanylate cyclase (GGDEF)-like protein/PAS domain S-box-containing protein
LIALLAVPSIGLIVHSGLAARREATTAAKAECLRLVNEVAGQQQALVAGAEQLATALSLLPSLQSRNPAATTALFSELLRQNPQYANIVVTDTSGLIWASAARLPRRVSVANRRVFQAVARTGVFSSDEYSIGPITGKPTIAFGYPLKNAAHEFTGMIAVVLDLDYTRRMFEKLNLPPGSLLALLDHRGVILARNVNNSSENLRGGPDIQKDLFTRMTEGPDEGTFEAIGNDGMFRLRAYKRISLPHESEPYLYIRSGIPLASATSRANAAMFKNLSVFVSLFLIGSLLAWYIGKRLIVTPALMLKRASERLASGADRVHVSSVVKNGELGEVARAFDGMADALVQRQTALRESEEKFRSLFDDSPIALVEVDGCAAKAYVDRLRASGVEDLAKYADDHPEAMRECASLLVSTHANKAALDLYEAPDMEVFRENARHFVANAPDSFVKDDFLTIAHGGHADREQIRMTRSGRKIHVHSKWTVPPGYEKTLGRILFCDMDDTESRETDEALRESEEKFRDLVEKAIVGVYLVQDGVFRYANSKCAEIHGYADPQEMEGLDIRGTFFPEDLPAVEETEEWVHGEGQTQSRQFRIVRKDGDIRHVETFGRYTLYQGRQAVIGMIIDITDRRYAEEALRWKTTFLEALVDSSQDGILVLDSRMQKVAQNQRLAELWNMPADVAGAEDQEQCLNFLMASVKNPEEFHKKLMHLYKHPHDTVRGEFELNNGTFVEAFSYPVLGKDSVQEYGRIWMFRDITEIRRYWDMLENLSTTDGLTGISNRRRFDEFLEREWRRSMREYSTLSLLIVDIDYFKEFNDRYGHLAGDDCLKQVAVTLGGTMRRASDLVARYGGDEFTCVLPGTGEKRAVKVAQRIADEVARLNIPHESSSVADHVTVSIGVATTVPEKGREYADLMRRADRCLYAAKEEGRNGVVVLHDDYRIKVKDDGQRP